MNTETPTTVELAAEFAEALKSFASSPVACGDLLPQSGSRVALSKRRPAIGRGLRIRPTDRANLFVGVANGSHFDISVVVTDSGSGEGGSDGTLRTAAAQTGRITFRSGVCDLVLLLPRRQPASLASRALRERLAASETDQRDPVVARIVASAIADAFASLIERAADPTQQSRDDVDVRRAAEIQKTCAAVVEAVRPGHLLRLCVDMEARSVRAILARPVETRRPDGSCDRETAVNLPFPSALLDELPGRRIVTYVASDTTPAWAEFGTDLDHEKPPSAGPIEMTRLLRSYAAAYGSDGSDVAAAVDAALQGD